MSAVDYVMRTFQGVDYSIKFHETSLKEVFATYSHQGITESYKLDDSILEVLPDTDPSASHGQIVIQLLQSHYVPYVQEKKIAWLPPENTSYVQNLDCVDTIIAPSSKEINAIDQKMNAGSAALLKGDLDEAENYYAEAIRLLVIYEDTFKEYQCFKKLGVIYLQRETKESLIQAAGLYNYALHLENLLTIPKEDSVLNSLVEVESRLLIVTGAPNPQADNALEENKKALKELRERVELRIEQVDKQPSPDQVKDIYQHIASEMHAFTQMLIHQCLQQIGPPPCKYAVIGLGSMARGEMTPFSDLEFAILIEEESSENRKFFVDLTYLLYLKVVNLGETLLPNLRISSLNGEQGINFFDRITSRGFAFDGRAIERKGCKTPLGNGTTFLLIQTPSRMAQYIGIDRQGINWPEKEPHLSMEILNFTHIMGEDILSTSYRESLNDELDRFYETDHLQYPSPPMQALAIDDIGQTPEGMHSEPLDTSDQKRMHVREYLAKHHLREEDDMHFDPSLGNLGNAGRLVEVKQDLYRLPHLLIDRLALLLRLKPQNTFARIESLHEEGILKEKTKERLKWLIAEAMWQRLQVYFYYRAQKESMNPLLKPFGFEDPEFVQKQFPLNLETIKNLIEIYQILIPFHRAIQAFLEDSPTMLQEEDFWDASASTMGKVSTRLLQYEDAKSWFNQALKDNPEDAYVLNALGFIHASEGDLQKAQDHIQKALEILNRIGSESSLETGPLIAAYFNNLGMVLMRLGDFSSAELLYTKALSVRRALYQDQEHSHIAQGLNNLGYLFFQAGALDKARNKYEEAIELYRRSKTPELGVCLGNFAALLMALGHLKEAESQLLEALKILTFFYGEVSLQGAEITDLLGDLMERRGYFSQAKAYFIRGLKIRRQILGDQHLVSAVSFEKLGRLMSDQGYGANGKLYLKQALQIRLRVLGQKHRAVGDTLFQLGKAHLKEGDFREARQCYERCLELYTEFDGEESLAVVDVMCELSGHSRKMGQLAKAQKELDKAETICQKILDPKNPKTLKHLSFLGICLFQQGNLEKAEAYFRKILEIQLSLYGERNVEVAVSLQNLGTLMFHQRKLEDGQQYWVRAGGIITQLFGAKHRPFIEYMSQLGELSLLFGDFNTAGKCFSSTLALCKQLYGDHHPFVAVSNAKMGILYLKMGRAIQAIPHFEQALSLRKALSGDQHPFVVEQLLNLSEAFKMSKNMTKAHETLQEAKKIHDEIKDGTNDAQSAHIENGLGELALIEGRLTDAKTHFEQALNFYKKVCRKNDPRILNLIEQLIKIAKSQRKIDEQRAYLEQALELYEAHPEQQQRRLPSLLDELIKLTNSQGDLDSTIKYLKQLLVLMKKIHGEHHLSIGNILFSLGQMLHKQQNLNEAESHYQAALLIYGSETEVEQRQKASIFCELGILLEEKKDLTQAKQYYLDAVKIYRKLGENTAFMAKALFHLGRLFYSIGQLQQAQEYCQEALDRYKQIFESSHEAVKIAQNTLQKILDQQ